MTELAETINEPIDTPAESQPMLPEMAPPPVQAPTVAENVATPQIARRLRQEMCAVRLMKGKWGISKKLDAAQAVTLGEAFAADPKMLSGAKKLINSKHERYRDPCGTLSEATAYWKSTTIPYPEDGIRLIRRDRLEAFVAQMQTFKGELHEQAAQLDAEYQLLVEEARTRLGDLFNEADYPQEVGHLFRLDWEFPSAEPPNYLMQISPALYQEQLARVQARFEEAVNLTTDAFLEEFHKMVAHLAERLQFGGEDGKPQVFRESALENMRAFFDAFRALNVGGNAELEQLVEQAKGLVGDVDAKVLRKDFAKRGTLQSAMAEMAGKLDAMMTARPMRQFDLSE